MTLDAKYVLAQDLWELFTDKDTGEFLRNGYILFYKDSSRSVGKPVFRLTGSPPDYSYIEYGAYTDAMAWRVDLNDQGAYDYNLYYYPYDAENNTELYFIQVYSGEGVFQFSRSAIPNVVGSSGGTAVQNNYIPNGQFLLHNNLPENETHEVGEIREPITEIAQGGWTFERPEEADSADFVIFDRYDSYSADPAANPRYCAQIKCNDPGAGSAYKDLRLKFGNVNRFSSTDVYTFGLAGIINDSGSLSVQLILIKNFGTGGSTTTETALTTFIITASQNNFSHSFTFGENDNKTIGGLDDDYIQLALRFPDDETFNTSFTDFLLDKGEIVAPVFPETSNKEFISQALGGGFPVPAYDGSNLYLSPLLTKEGWIYDDSVIGSIRTSSADDKADWEILPDGDRYDPTEVNAVGIPYSRLGDKYWYETLLMPRYGTGRDFVSMLFADFITNRTHGIITSNQAGVYAGAADGAITTGFTFSEIATGDDTINLHAVCIPSETIVQVFSNIIGEMNEAPTAGDSGFIVTSARDREDLNGLFTIDINSIAVAALESKYILFSNTIDDYYLWFEYNGAGTDPAVVDRTGIKVGLYTGFTAESIMYAIISGINQFQTSAITFLDASSIAAGSYWTFTAGAGAYLVYYIKDGEGADPEVTGKISIPVYILGSDLAPTVCSNTLGKINRKYFAVPDYRGQQFRVTDNGAGVDLNAATRFSDYPLYKGDLVGTYQLDGLLSHSHVYSYLSYTLPYDLTDSRQDGTDTLPSLLEAGETGETDDAANAPGQSENNVKNVYVNVFIRI